MKKYVLIPGRHHVLTNYMHDYFDDIARSGVVKLLNDDNESVKDLTFVWAVTSSNHSNTRRNPFPATRRESAINSFCSDIDAVSMVYGVNDIGTSERFAHFIINTIEVESRGQIRLSPDNCIVATSTPEIIEQFKAEGFSAFAPIELIKANPVEYCTERAWELVEKIASSGSNWRNNPEYLSKVHHSSREILEKYLLGELLIEIFSDPLGGSEGDITETRDYESYRAAFDQGADRKYDLISKHIVPGRIVDIGCATGSIIKKMSFDARLRESDIFGIEVARPLYELCVQSKQNGVFGNESVYFYQRNIMRSKLFPDNSIQTTTSFSLTHEVESYLGRDSLLKFISQIYEQTAKGGVYINVDVVGPEAGDDLVWLWLNDKDGQDDDGRESDQSDISANASFLDSLSTLGIFKRFVKDFRAAEGETVVHELLQRDGRWYAKLSHRDAADFIETKDYHQSWFSEMHERFCFWSFSDWCEQLTKAGFKVDPSSYTFLNDWIVENRYKDKVALYKTDEAEELIDIGYPDTTLVMIAHKP